MGSLNSEPLFDQSTNFSTIAEIHSPPATVAPAANSSNPGLPTKPASYSPLPSPPVALELHIVEDSGETGSTILSSPPKSTPSSLLSSPSVFAQPRPLYSTKANPGPHSTIDVSASVLNTELDSLVVLSQIITTTTSSSMSIAGPGNRDLSPTKPASPSYSSGIKPASPLASVPKSHSPTSLVATKKTLEFGSHGASNGISHVLSPEPKAASPVPIPVSAVTTTSPQYFTPPKSVSPFSVPKTSSPKPPSEQSEVTSVTPRPTPPTGFGTPPRDSSLDDALDNLLAMSFTKPGNEVPRVVPKLIQATRPEVFEEPITPADRRMMHPDTHTESEVGDGLLEDQSDCRSDLLDWADMELKLSYDGADGSMTPMTEASWMDESLTPSSCPGTPDAQMDLPMLQPANPMDRISASGHVWTGLAVFYSSALCHCTIKCHGLLLS